MNGSDAVAPSHAPAHYVCPFCCIARGDSDARVLHAVQEVATAMKRTYGCDGVTVRQNNEPAGGQSVRYVHVHVVPRYRGDLRFMHNHKHDILERNG